LFPIGKPDSLVPSLILEQLLFWCLAEVPCRYSCNHSLWGNILRHNRPSSNDGVGAYFNTRKNHGTRSNPSSASHCHSLEVFEPLLRSSQVVVVRRRHHWRNETEVFDRRVGSNVAVCLQLALRADRREVLDRHISSDDRTVTNRDILPQRGQVGDKDIVTNRAPGVNDSLSTYCAVAPNCRGCEFLTLVLKDAPLSSLRLLSNNNVVCNPDTIPDSTTRTDGNVVSDGTVAAENDTFFDNTVSPKRRAFANASRSMNK
jgi:hypothetical protein